ncbi:hypothetical protein RB614_11830 [Phytohabitans sp. ZYX-F-186]|uniref:Uncharacterized protein n=1 Tax=Phytohabitans maris TaxID=3071409 RepID=A0ABU0ZE34_9ACTN|nr:hypothetical protein [Phytohabitans sp. ZYX-F-186]MDQ7905213.1 hypothetical protein [Phytohabitans sp. ZYX-F-186]
MRELTGAVVAHLASPQANVVNGAYYDGFTPAEPAMLVDNRGAVRRLWKLSPRLTGLDATPATRARGWPGG